MIVLWLVVLYIASALLTHAAVKDLLDDCREEDNRVKEHMYTVAGNILVFIPLLNTFVALLYAIGYLIEKRGK